MNVITNDNFKCALALQGLRKVNDPELGLNVVDLGLIYQLDFDEYSHDIFALMTLSTPFCPMGESITKAVENSLSATFPGNNVHISLTFEPRWNATLISEEGKIFLNK